MDASTLRTQDFRRILLIKLSAVGDVVHTLPVLNKLRRRYPTARIDWVLKPAIAELIQHHPALSHTLLFGREGGGPKRTERSALRSFMALLSELRAARYDLVIDLHGQVRSAVLALAAGAPVRIGFDRPRPDVKRASARTLPAEAYRHGWTGAREGSWMTYTHHITVPTLDMHAVDRYLRVGPMLGFDEGLADFSFAIPKSAEDRVDRLLSDRGVVSLAARSRLALLAPGTIWETKHWTREGFAEVARHLMSQGRPVALIGSAGDNAACREVAQAAPGVLDLSGQTTLSDLAALMRRCAICVTNDSGPMHLAVALDRPVVSIFGPTDSVWIGPYGRPGAVLQKQLPCAPCYLRTVSRCRYGHACMRQLPPAAVIERIEQTLAEAGHRAPATSLTGFSRLAN